MRGNQREGGINKIPCPRKGLGLGPQTGDLLPCPDAPGGRVCAGVSSAVLVWVGGKGEFTGGEVPGGSKWAKGGTPRLKSCLTSKL